MDAREEQGMEVEALESIYVMDEFKLTASREDGTPLSFTLALQPHEDGDGEENHVAAQVEVVYNETYPETPPGSLVVTSIKGLGASQVAELQGVADAAMEESAGMAGVFTVAEAVKDWLGEHNMPPSDGSMRAQMLERQRQVEVQEAKAKAAAEAEAAATAEVASRLRAQAARYEDGGASSSAAAAAAAVEDFMDTSGDILGNKVDTSGGVMVTTDTFLAWRKNFELERGIDREAELAALEAAVTGRKWFQANSKGVAVVAAAAAAEEADRVTKEDTAAATGAGGEGEDDYGAAAAELAAAATGPIDSSVFDDDDDLSDLSGLSDEEDEEDGTG